MHPCVGKMTVYFWDFIGGHHRSFSTLGGRQVQGSKSQITSVRSLRCSMHHKRFLGCFFPAGRHYPWVPCIVHVSTFLSFPTWRSLWIKPCITLSMGYGYDSLCSWQVSLVQITITNLSSHPTILLRMLPRSLQPLDGLPMFRREVPGHFLVVIIFVMFLILPFARKIESRRWQKFPLRVPHVGSKAVSLAVSSWEKRQSSDQLPLRPKETLSPVGEKLGHKTS